MDKQILELEKSLFKYEYMSDVNYLEKIIDESYEELGKSGKMIYKSDVIKELSCLNSDRDITIYNFTCTEISKDLWMVHYITKSENKKIYRTSIWKKVNEQICLVFHQASEYKENVELEMF